MTEDRDENDDPRYRKLTARLAIRLAAGLVVVLLTVLSFEVLAWSLYSFRDAAYKAAAVFSPTMLLKLDPYEETVPDQPRHWRLKPGYGADLDAQIKSKDASGKWLGADALRTLQKATEFNQLVINEDGFKGAPIDATHKCARVLSLGDSVTFGIGGASYPHFMQNELASRGIKAEVINAGVEGYSPRNLLLELPHYRSLEPEIVTIYVGWNALYSSDVIHDSGVHLFKSPWLFSRLSASAKLIWPSRPDRKSENVISIKKSQPILKADTKWPIEEMAFAHDVEELIDSFLNIGSKVFVITLYGLYQSDRMPSEEALALGHLPYWTENPFELAMVTDQFNAFLRRISAKKNVAIIDMQAWGREALFPPEKYFFDSLHLNLGGLKKVGAYLAENISKQIIATDRACAP